MATSAQPGSLPTRQSWLLGRAADLFIGCGLAYLLSVPVLFLTSQMTGVTAFPRAFAALVALLINAPHYGATIVRVYDTGADRKKYAFFAVYVTIALAALFAASSWNVWIASVLITAYVVWSPWHFSGQNYGLMLMFLRRRGIDVDPTTKRLLYASFVLSAGLAIIAIQGGNEASVFAPETLPVANTPRVMHWNLPAMFTDTAGILAFAAYLGCLFAAAWRLRLRARFRDLVPATLLVLNQALWFTIPAILANGNEMSGTSLAFAAVWVNVAHSLQYLWVTSYYARSSGTDTSLRSFLLKSFVAGTAVVTLPGLILAPNLLGATPLDAGLAAALFSIVNIHHFILDGAIWKLRDGRVARVLLRAPTTGADVEPLFLPRRRPWLRQLVWAVAAASILIPILSIVELNAIQSSTQSDQVDRALRTLKWIGRETTEMQLQIAERYAAVGHHEKAIEHYRRSVELFPTGRAWAGLGVEYRWLGDWEAALNAFEAAVALNPEFFGAHFRRAEALLELESSASLADARNEAIAALKRALEIEPGYSEALAMLTRAYAEVGRNDLALIALERALEDVEPSEQPGIRAQIGRLRSQGVVSGAEARGSPCADCDAAEAR